MINISLSLNPLAFSCSSSFFAATTANAQLVEIGSEIERLLTPGLFGKLAVHRYVLRKNTWSVFMLGPSSPPIVVVHLKKRQECKQNPKMGA